jgi:hypothetical protein
MRLVWISGYGLVLRRSERAILRTAPWTTSTADRVFGD